MKITVYRRKLPKVEWVKLECNHWYPKKRSRYATRLAEIQRLRANQ